MDTNKEKNTHACSHAENKTKQKKITTIINISHYGYLETKKKKVDQMESKMWSIDAIWGVGERGWLVWCRRRFRGSRSGLLAAPLALHGPPQELLHVPRHVHGVVQVELTFRVQHGVTPAEAGEQSDNGVSEELSSRNAGGGPQTPFSLIFPRTPRISFRPMPNAS